ncbi:MAG: DUF4065 domain-containing protein [Chloroflexota bacterium]|nr:DUF4065 domain-containing protein [Chloroflexota bacterium]
MTVDALAAGKRMGEHSNWQLSNLAMQKLLYIAHMYHLGLHGDPLVFGVFEAWEYGPVHPSLYHEVKTFGADPVQDIFGSVPSIEEGTESDLLDAAVDQLSKSTARLVAITHWEKGAWAKCYRSGVRGISIPNDAILKEYQARMSEPQQ